VKRRTRFGRAVAAAATAAVLIAAARSARAEDAAPLERRVKAAFLYKFASYVEWPEHAFQAPGDPVTIGVLGDETLAEELKTLAAGRTAGGRPIAVRPMRDRDPVSDFRVLFVADDEAKRLEDIAAAAPRSATLVVSESEGALGHGAMINFVLRRDRVRFEVDLGAVNRGGLGLSSRLLAVAERVVPGPR
jgi:hypothetical protein